MRSAEIPSDRLNCFYVEHVFYGLDARLYFSPASSRKRDRFWIENTAGPQPNLAN